ncbi:hypothetical protein [Brucella tritici]|uniref:hypothetical protein n=1 Tax=Brucella tritici TaxID=94626 RepID=UPI003D6D561C
MTIRIVSIRPVPKGASKTIARFDLEVDGGLRIYGLVLREYPDGARSIAGPQCDGRRFATFLPDVASQITKLASQAYEGMYANSRTAA